MGSSCPDCGRRPGDWHCSGCSYGEYGLLTPEQKRARDEHVKSMTSNYGVVANDPKEVAHVLNAINPQSSGRPLDIYDDTGAFTAEFLSARGKCCKNGCKNCPYRSEDDSEESL
jgi:hypothetical protein